MWIYYYCTHGPGHQSVDYGFEAFHKSMSIDDIKECLDEKMSKYDWPCLSFWEIKDVPYKYIEKEIKYAEEKIEKLKKYINKLKNVKKFTPQEEKGEEDKTIQKHIRGCYMPELLQRLHKAKLMYSPDDISQWRYGKKAPIGKHREKILRILRKTTKYPIYKNGEK